MIYAIDAFHSKRLKIVANSMLSQIKTLNEQKANIDTILSRGSSGCALASAILALSDFELYHVYIRKPNEEAHTDIFSGQWGYNNAVIVDDQITSGKTLDAILEAVNKAFSNREIVGVIIHNRFGTHKKLKVYHCGDDV